MCGGFFHGVIAFSPTRQRGRILSCAARRGVSSPKRKNTRTPLPTQVASPTPTPWAPPAGRRWSAVEREIDRLAVGAIRNLISSFVLSEHIYANGTPAGPFTVLFLCLSGPAFMPGHQSRPTLGFDCITPACCRSGRRRPGLRYDDFLTPRQGWQRLTCHRRTHNHTPALRPPIRRLTLKAVTIRVVSGSNRGMQHGPADCGAIDPRLCSKKSFTPAPHRSVENRFPQRARNSFHPKLTRNIAQSFRLRVSHTAQEIVSAHP